MGKYIGGRCLELMPETIKKYPPQPCQNTPNDAALVLLGIPPKTPKNWWFLDVSPFNKGVFSSSILVFFQEVLSEMCGVDALGWLIDWHPVRHRISCGRIVSALKSASNCWRKCCNASRRRRETWITPRKRGKPPPVFGDHPGSVRIRPDTDFRIFQKWPECLQGYICS